MTEKLDTTGTAGGPARNGTAQCDACGRSCRPGCYTEDGRVSCGSRCSAGGPSIPACPMWSGDDGSEPECCEHSVTLPEGDRWEDDPDGFDPDAPVVQGVIREPSATRR